MKSHCILVACCVLVAPVALGGAESEASALLTCWCDGLVAHQLSYPKDRGLDGAMVCSSCAYLHGRISDTAYPFVVAWSQTGEAKYLTAARKAIAWCEANTLNGDGSYMNDLKVHWNYITVFSQIAIGKTLREYGEKLPMDFCRQLEAIYARQSEWLYSCFRDPETAKHVEVNYWGNQAEAMAEAGVKLHEPKYTVEAQKIVDMRLKKLFAEDGMLMGEIVPSNRRSDVRGLAAVDIGYNLEETLPAMLAAAEVLGDKAFEDLVVKSVLAHLEFMLPDGGIDDTAGSRGYKWTYMGSRTADGVLPLLAKLEKRGVTWARRAADRVIALHAKHTGADGLMYGGLYFRDAGEPACIHQTFTHVKGLAEYLSLIADMKPSVGDELMPRELTNRIVSRPSMGTELVAVGPWRATFSASDAYVLPNNARRLSVGGGSLTLLWHEKAGLLLAATQAEFFFLEMTNQQETRHERTILSATPRLETVDGFANVQDFDVKIKSEMPDGDYSYSAKGVLTNVRGEKGVPFEIAYRLTDKELSVAAKAGTDVRYYLPIVGGNDTEIAIDGKMATIRRGTCKFRLTASSPLKIRCTERGNRSFTTIGGLMTEHIYVDLKRSNQERLSLIEE